MHVGVFVVAMLATCQKQLPNIIPLDVSFAHAESIHAVWKINHADVVAPTLMFVRFRKTCRLLQILDALQRDYRQAKLLRHGATFSVVAAGGGLSGGSVFLGAPVEMAVGAAAMTLVSAGALQVTELFNVSTRHVEPACFPWLSCFF